MSKFYSDIDFYLNLNAPKSFLREQLNLYKYGIYYWFVKSDKLSLILNHIPDPSKLVFNDINGVDYVLVYIGIGPRNSKTKKQFFNKRILNCHLGNKISNSTFRLSISSCLGYKGFKKQVGKNLKFLLNPTDEITLTLFIQNNFALGVHKLEAPWNIEGQEIGKYQPPLNIINNNNGWNLKNIRSIRKCFRDLSV